MDNSGAFNPGLSNGNEDALDIFDVQKVDMQFSVTADFVAAQAANNTLVLALQTGRIMRIDLDNAEEIDGGSRDQCNHQSDLKTNLGP